MSAYKRLVPYALIFLAIQTTLRLSLSLRAVFDVEFSPSDLTSIMLRGAWFDLVTASCFLIPIALYQLAITPARQGGALDRRIEAIIRFLFTFILLFDAVAEHLFWTEFTTRFNFIAVDYLIYTQEVIGNIVQSYPVHWLILAIALIAIVITRMSFRWWPSVSSLRGGAFRQRFAMCVALVAAVFALHMASAPEQAEISGNAEATELAANGIYNLFSAFWNNEISYKRFYATREDEQIARNARNLLWERESEFVHSEGEDLTRLISFGGKELHKNVILVVMESLSADYMGVFGNTDGLTPNLDRLSKEGLFFTDLYATGTRTVRGLEALTLSIPPTPGQSIIRRPENDNLFSLGFVFKDRGYDTSFIYGGYGYFDNMNTFFSGNGFSVLDRGVVPSEAVTFSNVWGICDEDMFEQSIKQADASFANGKPFMHLIMTTSNHRPYTYPDGKIDIASHSGRLGGVKYADYSIGKLVEKSKQKPWFKDTVFIFVSDHTAGAGGKAELDPKKYHIPMIFYSPEFIAPAKYEKIASQIDMAPILLGLLRFDYYTKFFGEDLLNDEDEIPHAFISNFQKMALVKQGKLIVLAPKRKSESYSWPSVSPIDDENDRIEDTITYYQAASWWKEQFKRVPTVYNGSEITNSDLDKE